MNHFFATFPAGAGPVIEEILKARSSELQVRLLLDGAAEFTTALPYSDLNFFCFHNLFQVLGSAEREEPLDRFLREICSGAVPVDWETACAHPQKVKSFRLVTSRQNQLVSVDKALLMRLERELARRSGMKVDRSRPDTEFWLLSRSEGRSYFLKRLSRHTAYDKLLHPGELHPEVAFLLCYLTKPLHTDVVADPFCGYGAIPKERCKRFPFQKLFAFDVSESALLLTRKALPDRETILAQKQDLFTLTQDRPELCGAVDAIITDPPWGLYEDVPGGLSEFYQKMLAAFSAMLKPGGRAAVLTARNEEFLGAVRAEPGFSLQRELHILVSGKKCGMYLLTRNTPNEIESKDGRTL